jgi:hypothetical protein
VFPRATKNLQSIAPRFDGPDTTADVVQALQPARTEDAADAQGSRPAMDAVINCQPR